MISGRGIQGVAARYGRIAGNEVHNIRCGTGAAVLLTRFSDGWIVRDNFAHHNQKSVEHPMEEGFRVSSGSSYNVVEGNTAEDLAGRGRGFTTDAHAAWNVIRNNVARRVDQGFNQQTGGWGNQWIDNTAVDVRSFGFNVDGKDYYKKKPDDEVPSYSIWRKNCSRRNPYDLNVGAVQSATFEANGMRDIRLSENVRSYWAREGNRWDGSSRPPAENEAGRDWCE